MLMHASMRLATKAACKTQRFRGTADAKRKDHNYAKEAKETPLGLFGASRRFLCLCNNTITAPLSVE